MCAPGHQPSEGSRESCFKDRSHSFEFEEVARELWSILFSETRPKGAGSGAGEKVAPAKDSRGGISPEGGGQELPNIRNGGFASKGTAI